MSEEARLREDICRLAKSMFDRGLTGGSSGNISARLSDGRLLVTPTGSSFGGSSLKDCRCLMRQGCWLAVIVLRKKCRFIPHFMKRAVPRPGPLCICIHAIRLPFQCYRISIPITCCRL